MSAKLGRKPVQIELSETERDELRSVIRKRRSSQARVMRCKIVLAAAQGRSNIDIADEVGCTPATVCKWRSRFAKRGMIGLGDLPRPGRPRTVTDEHVEDVVVTTLEKTPENATHWSTRSMAAKLGLTQSAVHRVWQAFGLKPHVVQHFKLSTDPDFVDKVHDITGLYLNPPDAALVVCVDEKTQIQALERSSPIMPMIPGVPQRHTHDYRRHGTKDLFAALDVASGKVITQMTDRHRAKEFIDFLNLVNEEILSLVNEEEVPDDLHVHIILDNVSSHKTQEVQKWRKEHEDRFTFHFTPTYSSWINLVERWFSELTTKWIRRSAHRSVEELTESIQYWIDNWNENPKPFIWRKTAEQILKRMGTYLQRINQTAH